jgi:hypothetical protein
MARLLVAAAVSIGLLGGCAHDVRKRYPVEPGLSTGSIVLVLTNAASDVVVAVDGYLIVAGAHTKRIRIDDVPSGYVDVSIAIGDGAQQQRLWVESGRDTVMPIGAPGGDGVGAAVRNALISIAGIALYAWIRSM